MTDGGMMVSIGDTTYTSFLKDEVSGYRVIMNGKTCVFQKENDPTILRYVDSLSFYINMVLNLGFLIVCNFITDHLPLAN